MPILLFSCGQPSTSTPIVSDQMQTVGTVQPATATNVATVSNVSSDLNTQLLTTSDLAGLGFNYWVETNKFLPFPMSLLGKDYCQDCVGRSWLANSGLLDVSIIRYEFDAITQSSVAFLLDTLQRKGYAYSLLTSLKYVDSSFSIQYLPSNTTIAYYHDKPNATYFFILLSNENSKVVTVETLVAANNLDDYKPSIYVITTTANEQWRKTKSSN